jgi:hypothetical protein
MADGYGVLLPYIDEDGGTEKQNLISTISDDLFEIYSTYSDRWNLTPVDYETVCQWVFNAKEIEVEDHYVIKSGITDNVISDYGRIHEFTAKSIITPIEATADEFYYTYSLTFRPNAMASLYNIQVGERYGFGGGPVPLPPSYIYAYLMVPFLYRGEWYFRTSSVNPDPSGYNYFLANFSVTEEKITLEWDYQQTATSGKYTITDELRIIDTFF